MLKSKWEMRCIKENCMGEHYTRWYIKSPSGNFYMMYRGAYFKRLFLALGANDYDKVLSMQNKDGRFTTQFKDGIKYIYQLEAEGTYNAQLSMDIQNLAECRALFSQPLRTVTQKTTY